MSLPARSPILKYEPERSNYIADIISSSATLSYDYLSPNTYRYFHSLFYVGLGFIYV